MRKVLLLLLTLGGCAETHAPPFATQPYAPFSRSAAVAIANDEWRLWGSRVGPLPNYKQTESSMAERQQGYWQRVGEYWWEGMNAGDPDSRWTGKHNAQGQVFPLKANGKYAWSAAFISYVMRMAGAGNDFPYSADHATYINYAARAAQGNIAHPLLIAENPTSYAPRLGDIACFVRGHKHHVTFADLPTTSNFPSHCAIIVGGRPGQFDMIGGNVQDAVELEHADADAQGRLVDPHWLAVLRVLYIEN